MEEQVRRAQRRAGVEARRSLADEPRAIAEHRLAGHIASLEFSSEWVVGVTVADDGEPDLTAFVERHRSSGGVVALPVLADASDDHRMHFRIWYDGDRLAPGRFGIPTPPQEAGRDVEPDVVLVPLVRFDPSGTRLGRGGGFYDRWLQGRTLPKVGVAFECQRADHLDRQPHDVPLDAVVTDLGVRWFRPMSDV